MGFIKKRMISTSLFAASKVAELHKSFKEGSLTEEKIWQKLRKVSRSERLKTVRSEMSKKKFTHAVLALKNAVYKDNLALRDPIWELSCLLAATLAPHTLATKWTPTSYKRGKKP